jgi:hypothetical protein
VREVVLRTVCACSLAFAAALAALFTLPPSAQARAEARAIRAIAEYRAETWSWQRLIGMATTPSQFSERRATSLRYLDWVEELWARRAHRARRKAARPPHLSAWQCIHRYERHPVQGWATQTGNGYYGGLQMNLGFQRRYGERLLRRKGTANRWTPLEQMWVAERAYRSGLGFYPWPNSARVCGLI